jgi:RecA/RadA recombinase
MMPRRAPVKKSKGKPKKTSKKVGRKAKTRIRKDPHKEYQETLTKQGIATISKLSQDECVSNIPGRVSTGCLTLDALLRNPGEPEDWRGIPLSRVIEIYGPPHIGKSTLLDQIFAQVQQIGGIAVLADVETSRDRHYVGRLGVDMDKLKYLEFDPDGTTVENIINVFAQTAVFWKTNYPDTPVVMGWDALAGTATFDEMKKGFAVEDEDGKKKNHKPGSAAKAMALAARLLNPKLKGSKVSFVILNHEYDNIQMGGFTGKKRETYGGHGTRHMASVRIQLYNGKNYIKRGDGWILGREVVAKVIKNRLGEHHREACLPMIMGFGTNNFYTLYHQLKASKLIDVKGSWAAINLDGEIISFQGWSGLQAKCEEIENLYDRLCTVFWRTV